MNDYNSYDLLVTVLNAIKLKQTILFSLEFGVWRQ